MNVAVTLMLEGLKEGGCGAIRGGTALACRSFLYIAMFDSYIQY